MKIRQPASFVAASLNRGNAVIDHAGALAVGSRSSRPRKVALMPRMSRLTAAVSAVLLVFGVANGPAAYGMKRAPLVGELPPTLRQGAAGSQTIVIIDDDVCAHHHV